MTRQLDSYAKSQHCFFLQNVGHFPTAELVTPMSYVIQRPTQGTGLFVHTRELPCPHMVSRAYKQLRQCEVTSYTLGSAGR
jgi:hypothetical protein